jgi:hypothetical protein
MAAGCGDDVERSQPDRAGSGEEPATAEMPDTAEMPRTAEKRLPRARCPAGLTGCRTAAGTILYVERVDPDGDGDAHFVLASRAAVTAPGISVIDVPRDLRPHPLPGPGDRLSAAGLVQVGSHGQHQIEAVRVRVAR